MTARNQIASELKRKYGRKSLITDQILSKIFAKVVNHVDSPEIGESLELWDYIFSDTLGLKFPTIASELRSSYQCFDDNATFDPRLALFSLQTYYTLIVKVMLFELLRHKTAPNFRTFDLISEKRSFLEAFEYLGYKANIQNLLSTDPYTWLLKSEFNEFHDYLLTLDLGLMDSVLQPIISELVLFGNAQSISGEDFLWELYKDLFPKKIRHALGEYYTPGWLCDLALESTGYQGNIDSRVLDPASGSGVFLLSVLKKLSNANRLNSKNIDKVLSGISGFDINPIAVLSAKVNLAFALRNFLPFDNLIEIPIERRDSILHPFESEKELFNCFEEKFDYVVGNPPWVNWKSLPAPYREQIIPISKKYDLFEHKGMKARLGYAQDDLATVFMYVAIDKYLKDDGKLCFILPKSLLKTFGGGQGFRRMRLGESGTPFKVTKVIDFAGMNLFGATGSTMSFTCRKGETTAFPVDYEVWSPRGRLNSRNGSLSDIKKQTRQLPFHGEPIDSSDSVWITSDIDMIGFIKSHLDSSHYRARAGVCTWASGIYWVDILNTSEDLTTIENYTASSRTIDRKVRTEIEASLIYPLVRGKDIRRWQSNSQLHIILPQSEENFAKAMPEAIIDEKYSRAYEYFKDFRPYLTARKGYKKYLADQPFYAVYDIGPYTKSSYKACWKYLDKDMQSAVLIGNGKPIIPDLNVITISCDSEDEAHYISAMLNSSFIRLIVHSFGLCTRITPGIMDYLPIEQFDSQNENHIQMAQLSKNAHDGYQDNIMEAIDETVIEIFGIDKKYAKVIPENLAKYIS